MDKYVAIALLRCWSAWLGSDKSEIRRDVGYGVNILATLRPKKGGQKLSRDQLIIYESGMTIIEIERLHNIICNNLSKMQTNIIKARYHKKLTVKKLLKAFHIGKNRYYQLHDEALDIILLKF